MHPRWSRAPLAPKAFAHLPAGSIRAGGWLLEQLRLSGAGLTGRMMDLWDDVGRRSGWLGGNGESWERGPYYARGLLALAHTLGDGELLRRATPWVEWTLDSQRDDGCFGPRDNDDWWARMPMLDALRLHHEATDDPRVLPFLSRYFRHQLHALPQRPLADWARPRGGDNLDAVLWLYHRTGEAFLLELADLVHQQTSDWIGELGRDGAPSEAFEFAHGVNRAMGFKQPAVLFQRSHNAAHLQAGADGWQRTLQHHGQIQGTFSSDEFLHGLGSTQGTELCVIVELLASLGTVLEIGGQWWAADAIERLAYNALPAILSADHCGHQYFQQPNQVSCTPGPHQFQINHGNDLLFGPLTGYGCCAANLHSAWPLFVNRLWLATADGGLVAAVLAPCTVTATVAGGTRVSIVEETDYPFGDEIHFTVRCAEPVRFPLSIRIPAWAVSGSAALNGQPLAPVLAAGQMLRTDRTWSDGDTITVQLPMRVRLTVWERGAVGVERGPLVYALRIGEDWRAVAGTAPFADYEVHPTTPWNYALLVDRNTPVASIQPHHQPLATQPWAQDGANLVLRVRGQQLPQWTLVDGDSGPIPTDHLAPITPVETLALIPFGCARLRVSMFPAVRGGG